jgi:hypothetical protein
VDEAESERTIETLVEEGSVPEAEIKGVKKDERREVATDQTLISGDSRRQAHGVVGPQWIRFRQPVGLIDDVADSKGNLVFVQAI